MRLILEWRNDGRMLVMSSDEVNVSSGIESLSNVVGGEPSAVGQLVALIRSTVVLEAEGNAKKS